MRDRVLVVLQGKSLLQSSWPRISSKERPRQVGSSLGKNSHPSKGSLGGEPGGSADEEELAKEPR